MNRYNQGMRSACERASGSEGDGTRKNDWIQKHYLSFGIWYSNEIRKTKYESDAKTIVNIKTNKLRLYINIIYEYLQFFSFFLSKNTINFILPLFLQIITFERYVPVHSCFVSARALASRANSKSERARESPREMIFVGKRARQRARATNSNAIM